MERYLAGVCALALDPPPGLPLAGYVGRNHSSTGSHDSLCVRALYVTGKEDPFLLLSCDLLGMDVETCQSVARQIASAMPIAPEKIIIACTHTHSGPQTMARDTLSPPTMTWLEDMRKKLCACALGAYQAAQPVCLRLHRGKTSIQQNRVLLANWGGKFTANWEVRNWDAHPAETLQAFDRHLEQMRPLAARMREDAVYVLRISPPDHEDDPIALLINVACHPVALEYNNYLYSADFFYYAQASLHKQYPQATILFFNGCCGDMNPVQRGSFPEANRIGRILAMDVRQALESAGIPLYGDIHVCTRRLHTGYDVQYDRSELLRRLSIYQAGQAATREKSDEIDYKIYTVYAAWARHFLKRMDNSTFDAGLCAEITLIRIGRLCIVALPFEVFSGVGDQIRRELGTQTMICTYANGDLGYFISNALYPVAKYERFESYKFMMLPGAIRQSGQRELCALLRNMRKT